jgi:hypothetical protein
MRPDMFKVIVGRPRYGSGFKNNNHRLATRKAEGNGNWEALPRMASMKRYNLSGDYSRNGWSNYRKELSEHLNPLWGFFESRVGVHWDEVFSEVCEHIGTKSTVHQHVRDHIKDYVAPANEVLLIDGVPYHQESRRNYQRFHQDGSISFTNYIGNRKLYTELYVCPLDGVLKRVPPYMADAKLKAKPRKHLVRASKHEIWAKCDGIWYRFTLSNANLVRQSDYIVPTWIDTFWEKGTAAHDDAARKHARWQLTWVSDKHDELVNAIASDRNASKRYMWYGNKNLYAHTKRTLGKKDLKKLPEGWR